MTTSGVQRRQSRRASQGKDARRVRPRKRHTGSCPGRAADAIGVVHSPKHRLGREQRQPSSEHDRVNVDELRLCEREANERPVVCRPEPHNSDQHHEEAQRNVERTSLWDRALQSKGGCHVFRVFLASADRAHLFPRVPNLRGWCCFRLLSVFRGCWRAGQSSNNTPRQMPAQVHQQVVDRRTTCNRDILGTRSFFPIPQRSDIANAYGRLSANLDDRVAG